ncbi:hypothetical protein [Evansella tamaricis]|uniref:ABC transporter periplasmic binding protein yphF n=1 Tax=Evansella tamaricis TaxID=2069301 RepID=A0ABS6JIG0_9BACI|nr:hypothetical protein [Evansella tamaricis]MBU9713462.1 hypothetical protein [Evansella tamaricis]
MKLYWKCFVILLIVVLMSGCLYPDERRVENSIPYSDQLQSVESAVLQYRQDSGVLPIKTRDSDTPIFRKYPVDFSRLVPRYLQSAPGNSFESGGVFQYVLVHPEEVPQVKVIDLVMVREIQEFQRRIQEYRRVNSYAPVAEFVGDELLKLDHEALNYEDAPSVKSPFHPTHRLPLLMETNGNIVIDYSIDIQFFIEEFGMGEYVEGDDLRWLLVDNSPFVPVYSVPQTMKEGQIVFKQR